MNENQSYRYTLHTTSGREVGSADTIGEALQLFGIAPTVHTLRVSGGIVIAARPDDEVVEA